MNIALAIKHRTTHINRRRQGTRANRAITGYRKGRFQVTRVIHQQGRTVARNRTDRARQANRVACRYRVVRTARNRHNHRHVRRCVKLRARNTTDRRRYADCRTGWCNRFHRRGITKHLGARIKACCHNASANLIGIGQDKHRVT